MMERKDLSTEKQNPNSHQIDKKSTLEILEIINNEDKTIALAVEKAIPALEKTVTMAVEALRRGGHIIYVGAGTSGRLGVLDSTEMPPTYSAPRAWFQGLIAGGREALVRSIEGAEDNPEDAHRDLKAMGITDMDLIIGIASSSATPYVIGAIEYARDIGARTAYMICNPKPLSHITVDAMIILDVGPEIITGSTRMKSGTATKMALNMISTTTMIRLGKVYSNLMVDLQVVNKKLVDRGTRIIQQLTELNYSDAQAILTRAGGSVKTGIVMARLNVGKEEAEVKLAAADGVLRAVIGDIEPAG
ncbi:MAG: N-acetylmuramic acid 6-phosphate etherase [Fidelibacterota bacterium]